MLEKRIERCRDELKDTVSYELAYKTYITNTYESSNRTADGSKSCSADDALLQSTRSGCGHVTLLEAIDGIARGTTGLTSWGGGAVMADWLYNNKHVSCPIIIRQL